MQELLYDGLRGYHQGEETLQENTQTVTMHVGDIILKGAGTSLLMPVWFSDRAESKDTLGKCRDSLWHVFVSHF